MEPLQPAPVLRPDGADTDTAEMGAAFSRLHSSAVSGTPVPIQAGIVAVISMSHAHRDGVGADRRPAARLSDWFHQSLPLLASGSAFIDLVVRICCGHVCTTHVWFQ
jgi:hypothetical protein